MIVAPLLYTILKGQKLEKPKRDQHDSKTNLQYVRTYGSRPWFLEWQKIKRKDDVKSLLGSSPIRLTLAYSLLEGPASHESLYEKVLAKLAENFNLKISEGSYVWHLDRLMEAKVIMNEDKKYRLATLPAETKYWIEERFREKSFKRSSSVDPF
jgi:hypothetical protein